jgi:hypothetical protein
MSALLSACPRSEIAVTQANDPATRAAMMAGVKIKTHPADQLFSDRITFSVEATSIDGSPLRYQWQTSTDSGASYTDVSGENEPSIALEGLTRDAVGRRYRAQVSTFKSGKKLYSNSAEIKAATETTSASIDFERHPEDQETINGDAAFRVKVVVTDVPDIAYQWQVSLNSGLSFSDIPGATTEILSLQNLTGISNGNLYRIKVSSSQKDILKYSDEAILVVMSAISIQTQPQSVTTSTQTASFNISATASLGDIVLYHWMRSTDDGISFLDIPGENGASINLNGLTTSNNGDRYMVRVEAGLGNTLPIYSDSVTLTIVPTISDITHPSNVTSTNGSATFSVTATSSLGTLSYQWQKKAKDETNFTNVGTPTTTAGLTLSGLNLTDHETQFRAKISVNGTTSEEFSNPATLSIKPTVNIITHPANQTIIDSLSATFTVSASATLGGSLSYQWETSTSIGGIYESIQGANGATLSLTGLAPTTDVLFYRVTVTGGGLSVPATSNAASLTIDYTGKYAENFYINSVIASDLDKDGYGDYSGFHYSDYPTLYQGVDDNNELTYKDGKPLHGLSGNFCYTNGVQGASVSDTHLGATGYCNDLYYYQGNLAHGMIATSTSLLTHMNGDLTDSSPNPKSASFVNNATFSGESPFSSNGSLFVPADGTNNALSLAAGPHFDFGSGDWTIEFWIKANGAPNDSGRVFQTTDGDYVTGVSIVASSSCSMNEGSGECFLTAYFAETGTSTWTQQLSLGSYDTYGWTHFALTRSGSTITAYENGNSVGQLFGITFPLMPSSGNAVIGGNASESGARSINAYIDELRIVKGISLYNSTFSPATTELTNVGLPHPKCFEQGEEVAGIDAAGTGVCLGKYYVAGIPSAGTHLDITYDLNGNPLTGFEFSEGRYFVDGRPAQGYHSYYENNMYYQSRYFIAGWNASVDMFGNGVNSDGHGRWCENKLKGIDQCHYYVSGAQFNNAWSVILGKYILNTFESPLNESGTGDWSCNSYGMMNQEIQALCGYYYVNGSKFTGWEPTLGYYYIDGMQTQLDSTGTGNWTNPSAFSQYYIGGIATPLSQSGDGNWCGPDPRYSGEDYAYSNGVSGMCHNYSNGDIIKGCTNPSAYNYNSSATYDNGNCEGFSGEGSVWNSWIYLGSSQFSSCTEIRSMSPANPSNQPWSSSDTTSQNGYYLIFVDGMGYNVFCDMTSDGGGWTLMAAAVGGSEPNPSWTTSTTGVPDFNHVADPLQTSRMPDYLINRLKGNTGRYTKSSGSSAFFATPNLTFTSNSTSTVGTVCSDAALSQSCRELNDPNNNNTGTWGIYDDAAGNGWDGAYTAILQPADTATECGPGPRFGVTSYQCDNPWPSLADTYLYLWGR